MNGVKGPPEVATIILRLATRWLTPPIVAMSVYMLLRGHNAPGGGFIAALIAGAGLVLRFLALGPASLEQIRVGFGTLLGAGLLLAIGAGVAGYLVGGELLASSVWSWTWPAVGELKVAWSLVFDVGVFVVVLSAILGILRGFSEQEDAG